MNSSTILEIYRITLLSNVSVNQWVDDGVLEVYRITLLSNCIQQMTLLICVLEVYRITLLSNRNSVNGWAKMVLEVYRMTLRSNVCSPFCLLYTSHCHEDGWQKVCNTYFARPDEVDTNAENQNRSNVG